MQRFPFLYWLTEDKHMYAGYHRVDRSKAGTILPLFSRYDPVGEYNVLGFDHRCPFLGNAIGYANIKYFMLFLFYGVVMALYVLANMLGCCGSNLALLLDITANFDSG